MMGRRKVLLCTNDSLQWRRHGDAVFHDSICQAVAQPKREMSSSRALTVGVKPRRHVSSPGP
jgi:hypothetical protein